MKQIEKVLYDGFTYIDGGVCAAKGFKAGSVRCGVKESRTNDDTAIIFSECECTAAATYTCLLYTSPSPRD